MGKTHIRQKAVFSVAAGMILIPWNALYVHAEESTDEQAFINASGIESVLEECYETGRKG